jgi:hypothetical protein
VCGDRPEPVSVRVHPLDVDRRERGAELPGNLDRDRNAAARNADHERRVQPKLGDGFGQDASGGRAIGEERRDPGHDAHGADLPGIGR